MGNNGMIEIVGWCLITLDYELMKGW